jgi:hypothetical protein
MKEIAAATREQSSASQSVAQGVERIAGMAEHNADGETLVTRRTDSQTRGVLETLPAGERQCRRPTSAALRHLLVGGAPPVPVDSLRSMPMSGSPVRFVRTSPCR